MLLCLFIKLSQFTSLYFSSPRAPIFSPFSPFLSANIFNVIIYCDDKSIADQSSSTNEHKTQLNLSLPPFHIISYHHKFSLLSIPFTYSCFPTSALNNHSGGTLIDQLNLSLKVLLKTFSIGTSFLLQKATLTRGSM
jgi:hypothetical protein